MLSRRFLVATAAASALPLHPARAQPKAPLAIGFLSSGSRDTWTRYMERFRQGLREGGLADDRGVSIDYRWADGRYERLPALAADLVARRVDTIFACGGSAPAQAAKAATTSIPIVFLTAADPVSTGLVASISRPAGNLTGVSMVGALIDAKRLELLRELLPRLSRVAVFVNPNYPVAPSQVREVNEAAARLAIAATIHRVGSGAEIDAAFAGLAGRADAVLVAQDPFFVERRGQLIALADRHRLPAMYALREFTADGGLASYGPDFADGYRQAGHYVARILLGARPADLPVTQPTRFEFVINLKTAHALGLAFPPAILARADEVIE